MKQLFALLLLTASCTISSFAQGSVELIRMRLEKALEKACVTDDDLLFPSSLHLRLEDTLRLNVTYNYAYKYLNEYLASKDSIDVRFSGVDLAATFTYWKDGKKTELSFDVVNDGRNIEGINISNHGLTNIFYDGHPNGPGRR